MKRTPIRRVGRRRRIRQRVMTDLRILLERRCGGRCEACDRHHLDGCNGRAEHPHHVWPTGQGGPDTLDNLLAVSHVHHRWIHDDYTGEAHRRGLLSRGRDE